MAYAFKAMLGYLGKLSLTPIGMSVEAVAAAITYKQMVQDKNIHEEEMKTAADEMKQ